MSFFYVTPCIRIKRDVIMKRYVVLAGLLNEQVKKYLS